MEPMATRSSTKPASRVHSGIFGIAAGLACLLAACSNPPPPPPSVYDDAALAAQIDEHDGIDGTAPLRTAFVHGEPVGYWTIEGGTANAMPIYRLCRPEGGERCSPLDHPMIAPFLPGDDGYAPYGQVHWVELPEGFDGQLASVEEALAEATREPRSTSELLHCPIAAEDARIEVGDGAAVSPERPVYVRGMEARCFDFSTSRPNRAVLPSGELFVRHVYVLTREGEDAPLVEEMRMADMNGDGDQLDSNNVFGVGLDDFDYTPLWRMVTVTVPAGLGSIDTEAEYTDAEDMFVVAPDYTITPRAEQIVDHEITEVLINCPLQSAPGQL